MTANELFLKHAATYLGQYKGNLRWFCEAIKNGHVPSADDETIHPHVQALKRHMGIAAASEDDEFLLRFGLIVPGLMRGIRPPLAVLNPERGGFSEKRFEAAAAQVTRLREALRLGRRYLTGLDNHAVTALQELAAHLHADSSTDDDNWVELHAELSGAEAQLLANRAFASLDDSSEPKDLGEGILICLASSRSEGLGAQTFEALKRNLFWPSSIYRNAPDEVAGGLVERMESANTLRLNHLLLALAWTRGDFARHAFLKWRNTPPPWAASLHAPPEDYLHHAGWKLDANGERREIISLSCHRIRPHADASAAGFAVPCRVEIEKRCPACDGSLALLFDFTKLPGKFLCGDRTSAPRRVLCCLNCACYSPAVFSRYASDGTTQLYSSSKSGENTSFGGRPVSIRELIPMPQPPFAASEPSGLQDATSLGGVPMWLQDAEYPCCPECQNVMTFLAQFDNSSMKPPEEGIYYSFFCPDCQITAVNYQQT